MSLADLLDQVLADSRDRAATELHRTDQTAARGYARALWGLEADIRRAATLARTAEGAQP